MFERLWDEKPKKVVPAKLVVGLLGQDRHLLAQAESALTETFGAVSVKSKEMPFDFTDYYKKEMGAGLVRRWVGFHDPVEPEQLSDFKTTTGLMEKRFRGPTGRRVNIDPGLLSLHNLVLASTKDFAHRIYLRDGIYAEVTLIFHGGKFQAQAWTYQDYQSETCLEFLADCRHQLAADIARLRTHSHKLL
jgi:hypothetical protein